MPFLVVFFVVLFIATMVFVWFRIQYYHALYYTPFDTWIYTTDVKKVNNKNQCPRIDPDIDICRPEWMSDRAIVIHPDMARVTCKHGTWSWFRNGNSNIEMYRLVCRCNHDAMKWGSINDDCMPITTQTNIAELSNPADRLKPEQSVDGFPYVNPCLFDALTGERFASADQCVLEHNDKDGIWFCRPNDRRLLGVRTQRDVLKGNGGRYCNACVHFLKEPIEKDAISIYTEWFTTPYRHPIVGFRVKDASLLRENIAAMVPETVFFHDAPVPLEMPDGNRYGQNTWLSELNTDGAGFPGVYDKYFYFFFVIPIRTIRTYVRLKPTATQFRMCDSLGRADDHNYYARIPRPVEPNDPAIVETISEREKNRLLYDAFSVCLSRDHVVQPNIRSDHINDYEKGGPTNILVSEYGKTTVSPYRPLDTSTFNSRILNKLLIA